MGGYSWVSGGHSIPTVLDSTTRLAIGLGRDAWRRQNRESGLTGSRDACLEQSNHVLTGSSLWWRGGAPEATRAEAPTTPGPRLPGSTENRLSQGVGLAQSTHRQKGSSAQCPTPSPTTPPMHGTHLHFLDISQSCASAHREIVPQSGTAMDSSSSSSSASIQKTLVRLGGPLGPLGVGA
jgi:hypothetical protein